jgi:hypothetical protein
MERQGNRGQETGTARKQEAGSSERLGQHSHPRESGDPCTVSLTWVPAFAGMTNFPTVGAPCPSGFLCFLLPASCFLFPLSPYAPR